MAMLRGACLLALAIAVAVAVAVAGADDGARAVIDATFRVSDVEPETTTLVTEPFAESIRRLSCSWPVDAGAMSAAADTPLAVGQYGKVEHGLVAAGLHAFGEHLPLELRADDFWLAVVQGVAAHVERNAEELRQRFVPGTGKGESETLKVFRDEFTRGAGAANDWGGVVGEFEEQLHARTAPGTTDRLSPRFSTTAHTDTVAAGVSLMSAMQHYFSYEVHTRCGFPRITLRGTLDDWERLEAAAPAMVKEMCLPDFAAEWLPALDSVLPRLTAAFRTAAAGEPLAVGEVTFWESMVKIGGHRGSGGYAFINGWVNAFLPLDSDGNHNPYCKAYTTPSFFHNLLNGRTADGLKLSKVPSGFQTVPVVWNYYGEEIPLSFGAGFVGVAQDPASKTVRPVVGWAVTGTAAAAAAAAVGVGIDIDTGTARLARGAGAGAVVLASVPFAESGEEAVAMFKALKTAGERDTAVRVQSAVVLLPGEHIQLRAGLEQAAASAGFKVSVRSDWYCDDLDEDDDIVITPDARARCAASNAADKAIEHACGVQTEPKSSYMDEEKLWCARGRNYDDDALPEALIRFLRAL